jgi:WD40 repeat protein
MVSVEWMEVGPTSAVTPRRWWPWAAALVAVLGLGGVLWFVRPAPKTMEPTVTPLTAHPGFEIFPSFSPDGNQVAFGRREESQSESHIYVKLIGTGGPPLRLTTGPVWDYSPAWSPDGQTVATLRFCGTPLEKSARCF